MGDYDVRPLDAGTWEAFARLVAKQSWSELMADYDISKGRTWPLVLVWIGVGPAVMRRRATRAAGVPPHASREVSAP